MATQLELKNVLEQNPFEQGSVKTSEASFLTAALKDISSTNAQIHSDKFCSISIQPLISKNLVVVSESVEETSNTEVLTSSAEVLEKTKIVIAEQGLVSEENPVVETSDIEVSDHEEEIENETSHFGHETEVLDESHAGHATAEKIEEFLEEAIETLEVPVELATLGFEWTATGIEILSHHADALVHGLEKGAASFALVGLVAKVDKIHKTVLEVKSDEEIHTSKLMSLGLSIVEVLCNGLNFLSKIGIISHAMAALGRFNLIAAFCTFVIAMVNLGDSITNYKDATTLFKALATLAADAAMLGLIYYAVGHAGVLLLILGTGIFLLNVAIPDEEHHAVKEAH